jgi:ABC-2 type transport system ATP-binding protein
MLIIENLRAGYAKGNEVLKGINLSLATGKIHGLVGLNGAGKTTFLNILYQFVRPLEGQMRYNDAPLRRQDLAYLETENYFYPYMTGREYLQLFPSGRNGFDMAGWQRLFALPLDEVTESYSAGMRKKLALMAVFKTDKPVFILDEPFNGLDLESVHLLTMLLNRLRAKGKTVIVTSHIYESLTGCCDFIHYLHEGVIVRSYAKDEFPLLQKELQSLIEQRAAGLIGELLDGFAPHNPPLPPV